MTVSQIETKAKTIDHAKAEANANLQAEAKIGFLEQMYRIRRFEQVSLKHYNQGRIGGFLHLYIGQESIAVAAVSLMGKHDHIITAYRDHGHALAVGMGMNECMAELFGKKTGCSKGRGGSMHFFAPDKNYWGGHGIVAGQTPLGLGLAYGIKYRGEKGCSLTFLGDGAINQGSFHESLNLASLWDLPAIFIIENNGYSMGTSLKRSSATKGSLAERAEGYNIDWDLADGAHFYETRAKIAEAIKRAHEKSRPTVLEISTYRHYGHSVADANAKKYRTEQEIEYYKQHYDPIRHWKRSLIEEGVLDEDAAIALDKAAKQEADEAAKFAIESDFPSVDDIYQDVYWEVDNQTEAGRTGRHFFNT
ncbi:MAG: thiamine pyrophosphate-dependent dehydrogenase E1 component subunit alpha [Chthoniobacterales bacterium]